MIDGSTAQRCIDKLQRIQVRNCRNSNQKHVQCIEGLNLVVGGNASATQAIILCGWRPPQYFWFVLAGGTADIIQLIIDIVLHLVIGIQDAGICWVTGFAISIIFRHTLHRYLTFGKYKGGYCSSLLRTYATYSITMVLSTIFDEIATRGGGMPHYLAWVVTLLWTGLVNFFLLKWSWSFGGKGKDKKKPQVKAKESLSPLIVENDASTMA